MSQGRRAIRPSIGINKIHNDFPMLPNDGSAHSKREIKYKFMYGTFVGFPSLGPKYNGCVFAWIEQEQSYWQMMYDNDIRMIVTISGTQGEDNFYFPTIPEDDGIYKCGKFIISCESRVNMMFYTKRVLRFKAPLLSSKSRIIVSYTFHLWMGQAPGTEYLTKLYDILFNDETFTFGSNPSSPFLVIQYNIPINHIITFTLLDILRKTINESVKDSYTIEHLFPKVMDESVTVKSQKRIFSYKYFENAAQSRPKICWSSIK